LSPAHAIIAAHEVEADGAEDDALAGMPRTKSVAVRTCQARSSFPPSRRVFEDSVVLVLEDMVVLCVDHWHRCLGPSSYLSIVILDLA
jgi:hypothetical protein